MERAAGGGERELRPNGLLVLALVVAGGLAAGAGYYRWKQPRAKAAFEAELALAPKTPAGRLGLWLQYGQPTIHHRLQTARISRQQPWLVTHTADPAQGGGPEVWGIDLDLIEPDATRLEGLRVVVLLPAPRMLAQTELVGSNARGVPHYARAAAPADAAGLLRAKVEFLLKDMARALAEDIEGAELAVEVGRAEQSSAILDPSERGGG